MPRPEGGHQRRPPAAAPSGRVIRCQAHRPPRHLRGCQCAACDPFEPIARRQLRMPAGHPEWLTRLLPDGAEEYLEALAALTWPQDEWTDITAADAATRNDDDGGSALCRA